MLVRHVHIWTVTDLHSRHVGQILVSSVIWWKGTGQYVCSSCIKQDAAQWRKKRLELRTGSSVSGGTRSPSCVPHHHVPTLPPGEKPLNGSTFCRSSQTRPTLRRPCRRLHFCGRPRLGSDSVLVVECNKSQTAQLERERHKSPQDHLRRLLPQLVKEMTRTTPTPSLQVQVQVFLSVTPTHSVNRDGTVFATAQGVNAEIHWNHSTLQWQHGCNNKYKYNYQWGL